MKRFEVEGHEPSLLPEGMEFELAWSDEFDGDELDMGKWDFRTCMMGMRWPAWTDKGVHLDGKGNVVFTLMNEEGRPVSSQLQTGYNFMDQPVNQTKFGNDALQWKIGKLHKSKYLHSYGYYECRCRLQQKKGWWSAFWLQSPVIGASLDPKYTGSEVDIMESFKPGNVLPHNVITGGYGEDVQWHKVGGMDVDNVEEFHRFGVLWEPTGYTFYVDGVEDGRITENVSGCPQFILISTEPRGYRFDDHQPTKEAHEAVGDTFVVDYVRVFDRVDA